PGCLAMKVCDVPQTSSPEFLKADGEVNVAFAVGRSAYGLNAIWKSVVAAQSVGEFAGVSGPGTSHWVVMNGTGAAARFGNVAVWISKFPRTRTRSPRRTRIV